MGSIAATVSTTVPDVFPSVQEGPESRLITRISSVIRAVLANINERSNGDVSFTPFISNVYLGVNLIGLFRQILGIPEAIIKIISYSKNALTPWAAPLMGAVSSLGEAFCGIGNTYAAWTDTVPGSCKNFVKAFRAKDLEMTRDLTLDEQQLAKNEITAAFTIATVQFINQFFYLWLGIAQTIHGTLSFIWDLYEAVQKIGQVIHSAAINSWHLLPGLRSPLLHLIGKVSGVATGAFYLIRGMCIIRRSMKSKAIVDDFQKSFKAAGTIEGSTKDKVTNLMAFMQKQEAFANKLQLQQVPGKVENLGMDYLKRRFSTEFLVQADGAMYTANGKLQPNENGELQEDGEVTAYDAHNLKERIEYLKAIDKGIFTEQLKQKLGIVIGVAMLVGALATIAAALACTGPLAPLIIGLVSCFIFACMERAFYIYDNSEAFEKKRDSKYQVSDWLQTLVDAVEAEQRAKKEELNNWFVDMDGLTDLPELPETA